MNITTTDVSSTINKIESIAKATITAILNTNIIKELIFRNFLLSTKQFCIKFSNYTKCKNLLLKISSTILKVAIKILDN